jgi:nucleoside 2-deoxyribosyltransferase
MKSVYIFGPIYLFGADYVPVYKELNKLAEKYFDEVICTYPDFWDSDETPKEFYKRTYDKITKCDLFVAEVSSPSHGAGMELQMAHEHGIPVIVLVKEDIDFSKSTMVLGLPNLLKVITYKDMEGLKKKLEVEFKSFPKD